MALEIGSRLGHYEVTALIGEGGMGQVYQATDTKLNRQVALKILPEAFASDPDRLARFQREAQVLASLNHTNIGHIYGIEEAEGTKALVLELVEGPTLADRIAKGPIPLDEALPIAKQIAEALEAAHEAGVIHRDLKPANIKVREDGTVKVLDFGLAKAFQPDASDPNLSQSPTISLTAAATQMGMVIGTAAYMAPEQAKGKAVDKRVDVWAFGAVLFEMLTGRKPFTGDDVSDTLAAVLRADVDLDALPDDTPTTLRRVISACLQKDPRQRVHDVADVRLAMEGAFGNESPRVLETGRSMVHVRYAAASAVLTGLVVGVVFWYVFIPGDSLTRVPSQFGVNLPPSFEFPLASPHPVAISRDGRRLVFAGLSRALQVNQTFVRSLDELNPVLLRGSDVLSDIGGIFLSPNDEWVGFFDLGNSVFKRVRVTGGPPVTVAEVGQGRDLGASWGSDGTIVFATAASPKLMRVPEFGGVPQPLTDPADNETHFQPHFLPDGHAVLFTTSRTQERDWIGVVEIDSGQTHLLLQGSGPQFVTSGHLLFARDAAVWAVGFDPERLETVGDEVPVLERYRC